MGYRPPIQNTQDEQQEHIFFDLTFEELHRFGVTRNNA